MSRKSVKPARPRLAGLSANGSIKSVFVSKKAHIFTVGRCISARSYLLEKNSIDFRARQDIPDDFGDEALAGIKFGEEFGNRYGQPRPQFFPGSLDDALTDVSN